MGCARLQLCVLLLLVSASAAGAKKRRRHPRDAVETLVLWRHAEAAAAAAGVPDAQRPLTPRGKRQAARMAAWLTARLPPDARVVASPALRTLQTANTLHKKVHPAAALYPPGGAEPVLGQAGWGRRGATVVCGHQPALGQAAAVLLGVGPPAAWDVKQGGVWWFERRGGEVSLRAVVSPDDLEED